MKDASNVECCVNLFWSACVSHDVLVRMWQSRPLLAAHASCACAGACKWLPNKVSTKHSGSSVFNQIVAYYWVKQNSVVAIVCSKLQSWMIYQLLTVPNTVRSKKADWKNCKQANMPRAAAEDGSPWTPNVSGMKIGSYSRDDGITTLY